MRRSILFLLTTPLLFISHSMAVVTHEFGHSFMAWMLGIKSNPLIITWGDTSALNILTLFQIGERVDYARAIGGGHNLAAALTAATGPFFVNGGLYAYFRINARLRSKSQHPGLRLMYFWLLFMNLANLYDYVPIRTFSPTGDIANICAALHISPWRIYIFIFPIVIEGIMNFYKYQIPGLCADLGLDPFDRKFLLLVSSFLMFGYYGSVGFRAIDPVSNFLAGSSILSLPFVIILYWSRSMTSRDHPHQILGSANG
ncbi:hypothetical protein [Rhizobium oryzicola]|uniref:Peptidase M50 domain-containing protein n=1 Tax=Rhizobium oryzicola TaxID=1232668 RepID=A0ABT8T3Y3_9HYPH|nr:hypothetical protein [Rhizobium oryzicola]MDO1585422.1 hypothetical protein [Rhizobium oryzicola]